MDKEYLSFKTIWGALLIALGSVLPAFAQEDAPEVERDTVLLAPLYFIKDGAAVTDEAQNQYLWNELMKYKLWGTDSVIFNKGDFRIAETSGYTGTALGKVYFRNGKHTLGGPIISGSDMEISYPGMGADKDTLLKGPIRAGRLILPSWYNAQNVQYEGTYCFEGNVFFEAPDRSMNLNGDATTVTNRFIDNVHKSGGKVYADWDKDTDEYPGLLNLHLDGSFSECPEEVPTPEKTLSVPVFDETGVVWEPAIDMTTPYAETRFIHIPPISENDLKQSPKHVWFDKYVEDIKVSGHTGKVLYILMPSKTQNANGKTGRLTRVFSRDGFNFINSANDMKIQVAYVNDEATWNETTQSWDNLDKSKITVVSDSNYAGNLLFYTNANVEWQPFKATSGDAGVGADFQGTFMTSGSFKIYDHLSIAGQLIAGEWLWFESEFMGEFHYVPFNTPEIKPDIFLNKEFIENNDKWYDMDFYLTDTARVEVSFDYCFAFIGVDVDTAGGAYDAYKSDKGAFAEPADLGLDDNTYNMPLCKDGKTGHVVIKKGDRKPSEATTAHLKILEDGLVEGDEYMLFRVTNLSGAVISGNQFDGDFLIRLIDYDNKAPVFVDPDKFKLAVPENATKATAGQIKASDEEGDAFAFAITGGTGATFFEINPTTGVVSMKAGVEPFDYEAWKDAGGKAYTINVQVCDVKTTEYNERLCSKRTFKINITDVNETPYFTYTESDKKELRIAENETFAMDTAKFADLDRYNTNGLFTNDEVIAIGGDTAIFDVTKDGVLFTKTGVVLDYEVKSTYEITLKVRDATTDASGDLTYPDLYDVMTFTVVVVDVNDGPKFSYKTYNGSIDENIVGVEPVDMDHPILATTTQVGATITYSIEDPSDLFMIDPVTGVISLVQDSVLDYEVKNTYPVKVIATDASGDPNQTVQSDTADVIIRVNDINELPSIVHLDPEPSVQENLPPGTAVDTVQWDDIDIAVKFRDDIFNVVGGDTTFFTITNDGVIKTKQKFDYEMKQFQNKDTTYTLIIQLTDRNDPTLKALDTVVIHIKNVNEDPVITTTTISVTENSDPGTIIDTLVATDEDFDDPDSVLVFTLINDPSGCIEVSEKGVVKVKKCKDLDYEKRQSIPIEVKVEDLHGGYTIKTINVKVIDIPSPTLEIITAENPDTTWIKPDTIYTNRDDLEICWEVNKKKESCADTTLKPGKNHICKEVCNVDGFEGCATDCLVAFYSDVSPVVTISAATDANLAGNIYTIVEQPAATDTNVYVKDTVSRIRVTITDKDPIRGDSSYSFTIPVDLTKKIDVPQKTYDALSAVAKQTVSLDVLDPNTTRTPINGENVLNSYPAKIAGTDVTVSYVTDNKGNVVKQAVVNEKGKIDSIEVISVSYETVVDGQKVTISYQADAATGKALHVDGNGGFVATKNETSDSGIFKVSYEYKDKATGNSVELTYVVDKNGNKVKNPEGDRGYQVSYTYVDKYGNAAKQSVFVVLDQTLPKVEILSPEKGSVIRSNFVEVSWTIDGVKQDTLTLQGLEKGPNVIVRFYRDKAGNEASDTVLVIMKDSKEIDIAVEQPVTIIDKDKVDEYYASNPPKKGETFAVSIRNPSTEEEVETLIGGDFKTTEGSGKEPYPGVKGSSHLGPTLSLDINVPTVSGVGGLATLDDLILSNGRISNMGIGIDTAQLDEKAKADYVEYTVEEFVSEFCEDGTKVPTDVSQFNLYDSKVSIKIWVYSSLGNFVNYFSFEQELNDPSYANEAGMLQMFFEMKPDKDGQVHAENGKMLATGAYIYKVEAKLRNKLRCSIPPFSGSTSVKMKGDVIKTSDELLKPFGYKRPLNK